MVQIGLQQTVCLMVFTISIKKDSKQKWTLMTTTSVKSDFTLEPIFFYGHVTRSLSLYSVASSEVEFSLLSKF